MSDKKSILTACVHAGTRMDREVGGTATPIHTSSSFLYKQDEDICYPRYHNVPTQMAAADKIAALENAEAGLLFASGIGAIHSVLFSFLQSGDHVAIHGQVYGGTVHMAMAMLEKFGINYTLIQGQDLADFEKSFRPETKAVLFETPTNPLMNVIDIKAVCDSAKERGILSMVDNTFATPINQRPLNMGADAVIHSGTKFLGGHNDLCCGAVVASREIIDKVAGTSICSGPALGARDSYLLERSMKTLGVRMRQHNENGLAVAEFLAGHPKVSKVYYPGLIDNPGHETAKKQMSGFGSLMSMDLDCSAEKARRFPDDLKIIHHAISLGGVESLACIPRLTTHEMLSPEDRKKAGITDTLIRLSIGIENADDLIADLGQALDKI